MKDEKQKRRGLLLINEEERFTFSPLEGVEFKYRRIPDHIKQQFSQKFVKDTRTGELDGGAYLWAVIEYGLLGWSGIFTSGETPAPFTIENARLLETWLLLELRDRISANQNFEDTLRPLAE